MSQVSDNAPLEITVETRRSIWRSVRDFPFEFHWSNTTVADLLQALEAAERDAQRSNHAVRRLRREKNDLNVAQAVKRKNHRHEIERLQRALKSAHDYIASKREGDPEYWKGRALKAETAIDRLRFELKERAKRIEQLSDELAKGGSA